MTWVREPAWMAPPGATNRAPTSGRVRASAAGCGWRGARGSSPSPSLPAFLGVSALVRLVGLPVLPLAAQLVARPLSQAAQLGHLAAGKLDDPENVGGGDSVALPVAGTDEAELRLTLSEPPIGDCRD